MKRDASPSDLLLDCPSGHRRTVIHHREQSRRRRVHIEAKTRRGEGTMLAREPTCWLIRADGFCQNQRQHVVCAKNTFLYFSPCDPQLGKHRDGAFIRK